MISKSIVRKLFVKVFLLAAAIVAYVYFVEGGFGGSISIMVFLGILGTSFLLFVFLYWYEIVRPLRVVMVQIQALLAGKAYKRIYTERVDEVGLIAQFFNQVTKGLGKVGDQIKDRERMVDELELAAELQRDLLPSAAPVIAGLEIVAKSRPATEVGGDSYGFFPAGDKTHIYIGDVTGHGVAAGLIMTMVNSFVGIFSGIYASAYEIVVQVNANVKKYVKKSMFMTFLMLSWDAKTQKMTYVGAGHEHLLIFRSNSGQCDELMGGGIALGMVDDNSQKIKELELELGEGDFVILYTDGITEARNAAKEQFGLERLKKLVVEYCPQYGAEGVNFHIAQDVVAFAGEGAQEDDMTLIVIKRVSKV
ncbi:SpoIIE family protein phosphatase [Candidatus Gracilibacteria bacterium]|nr:SpoIIE family protein phosphatase [Candidatus Gracilibacteria bacterium]